MCEQLFLCRCSFFLIFFHFFLKHTQTIHKSIPSFCTILLFLLRRIPSIQFISYTLLKLMKSNTSSIHPSPVTAYPYQGWRGTPWTSRWFITGLTQRDKQPFMLTFSPTLEFSNAASATTWTLHWVLFKDTRRTISVFLPKQNDLTLLPQPQLFQYSPQHTKWWHF